MPARARFSSSRKHELGNPCPYASRRAIRCPLAVLVERAVLRSTVMSAHCREMLVDEHCIDRLNMVPAAITTQLVTRTIAKEIVFMPAIDPGKDQYRAQAASTAYPDGHVLSAS